MSHPFNPYDDLGDIRNNNQIPMFDKNGTALSQDARAELAKKRGQCLRCGVKTHEVKLFKRTALNNSEVYNGTCIRCHHDAVPSHVAARWDSQHGSQTKKKGAAHTHHHHHHPPTPPAPQTRMQGAVHAVGYAMSHATGQNTSNRQIGDNGRQLPSMPSDEGHVRHISSGTPGASSGHSSDSALHYSGPIRVPTQKPPPIQIAPTQEDYTGGNSTEGAWDIVKALRDPKIREEPYRLRPKLHRLRNLGQDDQSGALYEVKEIMEKYTDDPKVMAAACGAIWGLTASNDDSKVEACDAGVIQVVVDALRSPKNQKETEMIVWACGLLACLSRGIENKGVIANAGGIEAIVNVLSANADSAEVFLWACRALHSLVHQYDDEGDEEYTQLADKAITKNVVSIGDVGGVKAVVNAMKRHATEVVAEDWALKLLWRLLDREDSAATRNVLKQINKGDGVAACVDILKARSTTAELFEKAVALICDLLSVSNDKVIAKSAVEGIHATVRKMRDVENEANESLQEACCEFLATATAIGKESKKCVDQANGLVAVIGAMVLFSTNLGIQETGSWLLWAFSIKPSSKLKENLPDALQALAIGTEQLIDSVPLQTAACAFIANMAADQVADADDLPMDIPLRVLSEEDSDPAVREQACQALASLSAKSSSEMDKNVLNSLIEAAKATDGEAQESLCSLLQSIAASSETNRKSLVSGGCLDAATDMLQRSESESSASNALALMGALSVSERPQVLPLPPHILKTVLDSMRTKLQSDEKTLQACIVLRNLLLGSNPGSTTIIFDGLVDSMTKIIDSTTLDVELKIEACGVLWVLVAKQPRQSSSMLSTMFDSVVNVMAMYKGEEQPYNSDLQAEGAGALANITLCLRDHAYPLESTSVDSIIAVMYMVLEWDNKRTETLDKILDVILNLSIINEGTVIQCGGIVVVIDTMVEFEAVETIQERGCSILAVLASTENLQVNLCIAETDGIDMIVSALAVFTENQRIQVDACKALSHLSVDHESRMLIASQGGLILVLTAMSTRSNQENVDLLEGACSALLNLSSDADEQTLTDTNLVQTVVDVMRYHPGAQRLQEKGMGVLQNVSMRNSASKRTIAESGGIEVVSAAIKEYMGAPAVLERAFTTLWSLAVLEQNQIIIANTGGIGLVVNGMMANINYDKVQKQACGCLCTISSNSRNKNLIREAGGVDAIVFAMWAHFDSEVLQIEACRALSSLAVNVQTNEVMIATEGEISAIVSAMRRFPDSSKLQEHACVALRNFMLSADNAVLIRNNSDELVTLMTRAARQFPDRCAERANQVLASLS